ncbi:MAG: DNA internalization-related competence protein ComEC/Rec2 [Desulfobulbaceae bacterium]|jgi:competence protein ComEC|nr:DNA internalization-related competence protein ComEC/Rec2 [Desulfobulbaceae bacterium]
MKAPPLAVDLISLLALAFIGGLSASAWTGGQDFNLGTLNPYWLLAVAILLLPLAFFTSSRLGNRLFFAPLAIALFVALGLYAGLVSSRPAANDLLAHLPDSEEVILFGHVAAMPTHTARGGSQAEFDAVALRRWQEAQPRLAPGRVLVHLQTPWPENCPPGTFAVMRAKVEHPRAATVPGGFDHARYLAEKGIWLIAMPRGPTLITPAVDSAAAWWPKIHYWPELLRYRTGLFLDHHLSPAAAALYRAILIGDGSLLSDASVEAFIASGTMHIMVISGAHVAVLLLICFAILYWLLRRSPALILAVDVKKLAWLGCLPPLVLYLLLAGGKSPVTRAVVMCMLAACALFFHRVRAWQPVIALAALLLLLVNPQSLFSASFQLSFVAVLALSAAARFVPRSDPSSEISWRRRAALWLKAGLIATVSAAIGTAPLIIAFFDRLPLFGPLATLVIEPILSFWALTLGFVAMPFIAVFPDLAAWLLHIGGWGLIVTEKLAFFFAALPFASWRLPPPPVSLFILYYAGLILFLLAFRRRKSLAVLGIFVTVLSAVVFCSPIASRLQPDFADAPKVAVLDVDQGSATVIHTAPGRALIIDGGALATGPWSVGISIIAPYLWRHGVRHIELIALTHADSDHCNGVAFLLEQFAVGAIWVSDPAASGESFQDALATARRRGVTIHQARAGDEWRKNGMTLSCLANLADNERNAGQVLRFHDENFSMLFPGDINAEMEARLLAVAGSLKSDVLLAAHHGSRSSNSPTFLAAVSPRLIVASASASRAGIFPATDLVARCQANHMPLVTTGQLGSVFLRWRGGFSYHGWPHNGEAHNDKPHNGEAHNGEAILSPAPELSRLLTLPPLAVN